MSESYTGVRVVEVKLDLIKQLYTNKYIFSDFDARRKPFNENEYVVIKDITGNNGTALTRASGDKLLLLDPNKKQKATGIYPKNKEQIMALDALLDDEIKVVVLTGKAGTGKAQPVDAKVLTPFGWRLMGSLAPRDIVLTPNGETATIKSVHPQGIKNIFRVTFSDGSNTECCIDHLWYTKTQEDRDAGKDGSVKSLSEIRNTLRYGKTNKRNHSIPVVKNISFKHHKELELDPYLLGLLLGDDYIYSEDVTFSTVDDQLIKNVDKIVKEYDMKTVYSSGCDYSIVHNKKLSCKEDNFIRKSLTKYNLWGHKNYDKFIPNNYLFASYDSRLSLLQGLLDSGGRINKKTGRITFVLTSFELTTDIRSLVMSLGGKAKSKIQEITCVHDDGKEIAKISYKIAISLPSDIQPFRSDNKQDYVIKKTKDSSMRYIDSIEFIGKKNAKCILLDDKDHLYITDDYIVTHNTILSLAAAMQKMNDNKYDKLILTRSMSWVGKHGLGALPGDVDDKFGPYLQNYMCNIECLLGGREKAVQSTIDQYKMKFVPIQLIRGASWANTFIIADEVQTLGYDEMVALGTRIGEGSKIVIMGDLDQRDENISKEKTGIYKFVNSELSKSSSFVSSIDLLKCERSKVSALFADVFER